MGKGAFQAAGAACAKALWSEEHRGNSQEQGSKVWVEVKLEDVAGADHTELQA